MKLRIAAIVLAIAAVMLAGCTPAQTADTTVTPAPTQTQAPARKPLSRRARPTVFSYGTTIMRTIGCLTTEAAAQAK